MTIPYIDLTKQKKDYVIRLETANAVYELVIVNPKDGSVTIVGSKRFAEPTPITIKGSIYKSADTGDYITKDKQIHKNMKLQIKDDKNHIVFLDDVFSARIEGPNNSWHYEVWE